MSTYLEDFMLRVVDMQKACLTSALAAGLTVNAVPRFFFTMETFPYWINAIGPVRIFRNSEDFNTRLHTFTMRMVIGHITSGYVGEAEDELAVYIPEVEDYFASRPMMRSPNYPTDFPCLWMNPEDGFFGAQITDITGLQIDDNSGVGARQVFCDFTLRAAFAVTVRS